MSAWQQLRDSAQARRINHAAILPTAMQRFQVANEHAGVPLSTYGTSYTQTDRQTADIVVAVNPAETDTLDGNATRISLLSN